jgi:hypothetical protein
VTSDTWKPGSTVAVTFHSAPIALGDLTASDAGAVSGTFAVPPVAPGAHTVQLDGTGEDDAPQTLTMGFTVVASTTTTVAPSGSVGGTTTGTTSASGPLAITGASTRDLASAAVLTIAAGLVLIDVSIRRRARA